MKNFKINLFLLIVLSIFTVKSNAQSSDTFNFTGAVQNFIVPSGVDTVFVELWGAQGVNGTSTSQPGGIGGKGGFVSGKQAVSVGDTLFIYVGGLNSWNGGGKEGIYGLSHLSSPPYDTLYSGNGGGASDIRIGGINFSNRIAVAAGGGGGAGSPQGSCLQGPGGNGGDGGGITGNYGIAGAGCGTGGQPGAGGAASFGGSGGNGNSNCGNVGDVGGAGTSGVGGNGGDGKIGCSGYRGSGGGGGGGGYFGGGGGGGAAGGGGGAWSGGGGGGGSSYLGQLVGASTNSGVKLGNGLIIISYEESCSFTINQISSNNNPSSLGCQECAELMASVTGDSLSYMWSNNDTSAQITVCPTTTTSYQLIVNSGSDSTCTDTVTITQNVIDARSPYRGRAIMCYNYRGRYRTMHVYSSYIERYLNAGATCGECNIRRKNNVDFSFDGLTDIYSIYPNPSQNQITTEWFNLFNETVTIELVDMTGRVVKSIFDGEVVEGEMSLINTDVSNLPTGMYFMRYSSETDIRVNKVQLVR